MAGVREIERPGRMQRVGGASRGAGGAVLGFGAEGEEVSPLLQMEELEWGRNRRDREAGGSWAVRAWSCEAVGDGGSEFACGLQA